MKNIIYLLFVNIIFMSSCNDFLEENPDGFFSSNNFYNSEGDAEAAVNAIYSHLNSGAYYGGTTWWQLGDITTDLLTVGPAPTSERVNLQNYTFNSSEGVFEGLWQEVYESINHANAAIERIENTEINAGVKARLIGEAKFLRALAYFNLVTLFGDVPLIVSETNDLNIDAQRTNKALIFDQVISDLEDAEQAGLEVNSAKGKVTDVAVKALLGKVLLTRFYEDGDNSNLTAAISKFDAIAQPLSLSPAEIWDPANEGAPEHIFSVQYVTGIIGSGYMNLFAVRGAPAPLTGFSSALVEQAFLDSFDPLDLRKDASVRTSYILPDDTLTFAPHVWKYFEATATNPGNTNVNWPILRMSDVWLMKAEAANALNGSPNAEAYTAINEVRNRAGLDDLATGLSQDQFLDAVVQERAWEFCFEGQRWFDLKRTGKLISTLTAYGKPIDATKHTVYPIPLREVDVSGISQNPNY